MPFEKPKKIQQLDLELEFFIPREMKIRGLEFLDKFSSRSYLLGEKNFEGKFFIFFLRGKALRGV